MNNKRHSTNEQLSLDEINNTIKFDHRSSNKQKFLSFLGPGLLVAVGYMDPGNWITSMQGGAQYGYTLLFVILISSLSAMLLQSMTVRLGIATDIAEVIGSAIALNLLFNIPLIVGALITVLDVFLLLFIMKYG
ncbi:divalent metal cation transporter, partial [Staphylococcus aureus]|nr:divalent metal cation transporter [Staphylococcus aureus]